MHSPESTSFSAARKWLRFGFFAGPALIAGALLYFFLGGGKTTNAAFPLSPDVLAWWIFTISAILALFLLAYLIVRKLSEKEDDPLLPVGLTLLLLVVLLRAGWEIDTARKTIVQAFQDPTGICQVILVVFFIGVGACVLHFLWLRGEYKGFMNLRSRLQNLSVRGEEDVRTALTIMGGAQGLLQKKWRNVQENLQADLDSDFDGLIGFPDQREFLKEAKLSFIIKILPIIGMVGTVLGFTVATVGMQEAAGTMSDFSSFKGNLLDALGGMKTAFLTTLVGMVAMLLVLWVNTLIEQARRQILSLEAEFLYIKLYLPLRKVSRETLKLKIEN